MKISSMGDKTLIIFCYIITGVFAILCMLPLWLALVASFTNENSLVRDGYGLFVKNFDLTAYKLIFQGTNSVLNAYIVTIFTALAGTLLTLLLTSTLSYPLSVKGLKYRNIITFFVYFTMVFGGGLVPTYIIYTKILHFHNNILVLIIPGALNGFNMFLMKNYFATIPDSMSESAKIDGASEFVIFAKIILPLSKPILATIGLFAAMGYWNSWYNVLLYIDDKNLYTLQFLIMQLQSQVDFISSSLNKGFRMPPGVAVPTISTRLATAMISIGPIILLYPFLQKYFIKGIMIGAVKG